MIILKTKNYIKDSKILPKKEKAFLKAQEDILKEDIFNIKLHTKKLKGFQGNDVFSFRITSSYRGLFRISAKGLILFAIGHRKDIYK